MDYLVEKVLDLVDCGKSGGMDYADLVRFVAGDDFSRDEIDDAIEEVYKILR